MQVGQFAENSFGVQDLVGNVMEWVQDCYQANYANAPADASAVQVPGCAKRVARGGSYRTPANMLRVTKRFQFSPQARLDFMGFRVVRD